VNRILSAIDHAIEDGATKEAKGKARLIAETESTTTHNEADDRTAHVQNTNDDAISSRATVEGNTGANISNEAADNEEESQKKTDAAPSSSSFWWLIDDEDKEIKEEDAFEQKKGPTTTTKKKRSESDKGNGRRRRRWRR